MADLWERLRAAESRSETAPSETKTPESPSAPKEDPAPQGWVWIAPLVARRIAVFDLDPHFWSALSPTLEIKDWDGVYCFDTETTGLSGGAGTVAFLIGWATLRPGVLADDLPRVEVTQWFLRDHPGEPDLIEAIDEALSRSQGLVSFNGASFDLPLLRSRWALAGREFPNLPHRDDLHPSRRLWKRLLDSCRLSRLEESVLGIRRTDDVPGALVPALWFDYLRKGANWDFLSPLEGVLRHHAQDVYSLLCIDLIINLLLKDPSHPRWVETFSPLPDRRVMLRIAPGGLLHPDLGSHTSVDFWGLLRLRSDDDQTLALEAAWSKVGNEALGLAWADKLKRQGSPLAREIWTELWIGKKNYPALLELLKWLEHREKSEEARTEALGHLEAALKAPFLPRLWKENLEKRRMRLLKKAPS